MTAPLDDLAWPDDTIVVGRLGKPLGVKGEVTVEVRTDAPDRRFALGSVLRCSLADPTTLVVEDARPYRGAHLVVAFDGFLSREQAEQLRGALVGIAPHELGDASEGEGDDAWWDAELEGLDVVTTAGARVGTVREVLHPPGGDLLAVDIYPGADRGDLGGADPVSREVLVPFVAAIVPEVDVAGGRIVIDPPEGLLELSLGPARTDEASPNPSSTD